MRRNTVLATLAVGLAAAMAPPAGSATPSGKPAPVTQLQTALLAQINGYRVARGLGALRLSPALTAAANGHSGQMARMGFFSHNSANGASFSQRVARFYRPRGFRSWTVGENLVWGGLTMGPFPAFPPCPGAPFPPPTHPPPPGPGAGPGPGPPP